ncbi:MAG TPA: hypothetical protein DDY59_00435 [Lachnospiraceae bacterium]|jgi:hypothetical protein|nr:hypothetical protein [Lachnospiraceae bacterium]HCA69338.1 hypothetical protein [Lachnospiraceae bacterium]HCM12753.1 hypothetical protein [Lachnospiraceae bacterium]HCR39383.1 hypothetical protein [Lachnospiraceae bacterium]
MDKKIVTHEIAMTAAKCFVDSNKPDYIHRGTDGIVEDMVKYYLKSYDKAVQELDHAHPKKDGISFLK